MVELTIDKVFCLSFSVLLEKYFFVFLFSVFTIKMEEELKSELKFFSRLSIKEYKDEGM